MKIWPYRNVAQREEANEQQQLLIHWQKQLKNELEFSNEYFKGPVLLIVHKRHHLKSAALVVQTFNGALHKSGTGQVQIG